MQEQQIWAKIYEFIELKYQEKRERVTLNKK